MDVVAHLYRNHRGAVRHEVSFDATLRDPAKRPFDVLVEELSATGFLVPVAIGLSPGEQITLGIPGVGMCHARVVRKDARGFGCAFLFPLGAAELEAALAAVPSDPVPLDAPEFAPAPNEQALATGERLSPRVRLAILMAGSAGLWVAFILAWHAVP